MSDIEYNFLAVAVLGAWIPAILVLFAFLPPRRAVIASFVIGYLFLPDLSLHFHTLPDINKASLTAIGVILASLLFDGGRLFAVRPRIIDIPCIVLCLSPIATSWSNDLGLMDGLSMGMNIACRWGLAYWIGRAYFTDWEGMRELAMGIVMGGIAYAPLCWWEIRMSPQLHGQIYGWTFASFRKDANIFGYRPNVFLANGLTVTMFMGASALLAFWAWMTQSPRRLLGAPMAWIAVFLLITTIFCKALGGLILLVAGIGVLLLVKWPKTRLAVLGLILAAPTYMVVRATGDWSGERMVRAAAAISEERAQSLEFRLKNENLLAEKAMRQPWLGWGGWSRSHVWDPETGRDLTIVDGLWIITLGERGVIGLAALTLMVLGAAFLLWRRIPTPYWTDAACAAPVALSVVISLYMIDGLFNATFNPVASLAVGAVASIAATAKTTFGAETGNSSRRGSRRLAATSSLKAVPYVYSPGSSAPAK